MKSDFRPLKMRIAEDIKKYIERHPDMERLPPVRRLSAMFRVSANTVMDAVRLLDEQSIVIRQRGSGVVIAGRASEAAAPDAFRDRRTAAEKVHAHVRDRINDGHFKHNNPLPKTAFLAAQLGVSHHAVTAAYRRLSAANLAHKQGRRWIAGPRKTAAIASPARLPAILLLQSRENFWADMAKRDFFEAFCRSFQSEVESYDVQLMPALFDANSPSSGILPAGAREVTRTIRSLGHRYRGCLICNAIKEQPRLLNWIEQLTGFKQPVVWFDRLKERPDSPFSSAWYVRCHEAEEYAVELALTHLHELRHRHIAFPYYANLGWVQNRLRIMRKLAAQLSFGSLRHSPPHDSLFFTTDLCAQAALLRSGSELGFPCITNALSYIEENWDEMSGAIPALSTQRSVFALCWNRPRSRPRRLSISRSSHGWSRSPRCSARSWQMTG
jgi:DNA-binding FadR family transcriptional regulator